MLDKIKEFLVRLVKDDDFRDRVEQQPTPEAQESFLAQSGYSFSALDLDSAAIKILELAEQGQFTDLNEGELIAVFGGQTTPTFTTSPISPPAMALYGVSIPPQDLHPAPITPTPHPNPPYWGWWWRVRNPHNPRLPKPPIQGMYGVSVPRTLD